MDNSIDQEVRGGEGAFNASDPEALIANFERRHLVPDLKKILQANANDPISIAQAVDVVGNPKVIEGEMTEEKGKYQTFLEASARLNLGVKEKGKAGEHTKGVLQNLQGALAWMGAKGVRVLTATSLLSSMATACARPDGGVITPEATTPAMTETIPTPDFTVTPGATATATEAPVPEPIIGLPESLDKAQVIDYEDLDEFMPKLAKAGREYLDANGYPEQQMGAGAIVDFDIIVPQDVNEPPTYLLNYVRAFDYENDYIKITYWGLVKMEDGTYRHLIQVPLVEQTAGGNVGYVVHLIVNFAQAEKEYRARLSNLSPTATNNVPYYPPEEILASLKTQNSDNGDTKYYGVWTIPFYIDTNLIKNPEDLKIMDKYKDQLKMLQNLYPLLKKDDGSFSEYYKSLESIPFLIRGIRVDPIQK